MTFIEIIERLENEIKILENNINSLRENNKILLDQRNEYMELVELGENEIKNLKNERIQIEQVLKALRSADMNNLENYTYAKQLLEELEKKEIKKNYDY
ncbi:hypothetical protein [Arcobacter sp.]|uniref:hypothetical protein n=1 Tax=Arcobacter sp. TaxID=1872629 RepID=UPI003D0D485E